MSDSTLATYKKLSPNNSGARTELISRITPHCVVGQLSIESLASIFYNKDRKASSNYGIGYDGRVGLFVPESKRSWCSSSAANDQRAVTIECASDAIAPYKFNAAVYAKLEDLCTDICERNGKSKLIWIPEKEKALAYDAKKNEMLITVHRWFAAKACPGDWLMQRLPELAKNVTARLEQSRESDASDILQVPFKVKITRTDLNIRSGPSSKTKKVDIIKKGVYTIIGVKSGYGSTLGWGSLKSGAGWISLDFVNFVE